MVTGSFNVIDIAMFDQPLLYSLPGIFVGFLYILTIKFRKSPFDISMSHHAHQEVVRGVITEFSGTELAMVEIAHRYENVLLLGIVALFFASSPILGVALAVVTYFLEIFIDNANARLKWKLTLGSAWVVALVLGAGNIAYLALR